MENKQRLQIGIMGSAADLRYSQATAAAAEEIGRRLAEQQAIVVFGAEKDVDSLSTAASRGAKRAGGLTVGITYGKGKAIYEEADVVIPTGLERGGGREFVLALACDAIITLGGGSGTISEVAAAYQAVSQETPNGIPVVALTGTGGWSDLLAGKPLDARNRQIFAIATTPEEAVEIALQKAEEVRQRRIAAKKTKELPAQSPEITIFSTRATDIVIQDDIVISEQEGGPALFLERAFKDSGVPYQMVTGEKMEVRILLTDNGEFGKIDPPASSRRIPTTPSSWIVVSTLLNEWDITSIKDTKSKVFLDIQGYVRDGNDFGKKKQFEGLEDIAQSISCLKGTREEMSYLPQGVIEDQKTRLLVITDGVKGVEVFYQGERFYISPPEVVNSKDTMGAGDTFFGYFIASLFQGLSPQQAAESAVQKTVEFLKTKL